MDFLYTYHPIWILVAVLIAFIYTFILYRKDRLLEDIGRALKWGLAVFRFIAVFVIAILLLGIILENFTERKEKPLLFVVNDNSASVLLSKDSTYYQTEYLEKLKQFSSDLEEGFEVINYDFSASLSPGFAADYDGKSTDISAVFNGIYDEYTNRNIGGIVLASDGIYNTGANPLYAIARKSFLPIFTIGLGDTSLVRDVRVDRVNHNEIAFLGNQFPVEVSISESLCNSENVSVAIYDGDKLIKQERITFNSDEAQVKVQFVLTASRIGFRKFRAVVSAVDNEYSIKNNSANFYIEVIDGRQKILIATKGPHPDVGAIRFVIDNNKNYEVDVMKIDKVDNLTPYDLVIVHNYEDKSAALNTYIENGEGPVLFILGAQSNMKALEKLKVGFTGSSTDVEEVGFAHNPNYKEILVSPASIQVFSNAPPLQAPFGNYKFSDAVEILAFQRVGNISLDKPLIYFSQKQESRFGVIMGEGIWRWRLYDQLKNRSTDNFSDFFGKIITYLAVKENKDPFKVHLKNEYTENETILIKAELYNKSFDLVNEPEVSFKFSNEEGDEFESFFVKTANAYQLDLGKLKQGVYSWTASTVFQDQRYSKSGTFLVREIKIEYLNSVANHRLLRTISSNSAGSFYFPTEIDELKTAINKRDDMVTVVYQEKEFDDLIDYKWLFFLIVALFTVEWFIRKFNGAY
ncbi:MAG: hypothetical protein ACI8ZM_002129 [Crocinitomix sp.]